MKNNILFGIIVALTGAGIVSCSQDTPESGQTVPEGMMRMTFNFSHPSTRATETAFESGDKVGLFVSRSDAALEIAGNVVNNELLTFNGNSWNAARPLYWDNGNYNAVGYYPYMSDIPSISDLPFSVALDQSKARTQTELSGYEASDFLYASANGIIASNNPVDMTFSHILSKITIRLIKGEDFEGDMPEKADVYLHNTVTEATIDLAAGIATKAPKGTNHSIKTSAAGNYSYTAIVVPQRLDNRVPLIEVIMNGVSYLYESKFIFKAGVHHVVNLVVDKNPEQLKIEIGGEIADWN